MLCSIPTGSNDPLRPLKEWHPYSGLANIIPSTFYINFIYSHVLFIKASNIYLKLQGLIHYVNEKEFERNLLKLRLISLKLYYKTLMREMRFYGSMI